MKALAGTIFLSLLFILSCTKPPDYSNTPEIAFVSFSKNPLTQGFGVNDDFTTLTISFTDGDGDLGGDTISTIYFDDLRTTTTNDFLEFGAPLIPEQGTGNGISGDLIITLPTTCCIHPDSTLRQFGCEAPFQDTGVLTDTVVYEIYILDRAGNKSNVIRTEPLILLCDEI
ncbi:MAG: hypothetical protein AAF573_10935 [Bacteroidota bacterium]